MSKHNLSYIAEPLRPLAVLIEDLVPDKDNARLHPEENLAAIEASLRRFGQDQPLVVQKNGMIVRKGNGRLQVAKKIGWTHVACVIVDEDNWEAAARAIADNRSAELARWDPRVLAESIEKIREQNIGVTEADLGFTSEQLQSLATAFKATEPTATVKPPAAFPSYDETIETKHECPKCGYKWS